MGLLVAAILVISISVSVAQDVPRTMSYQGIVQGSDGKLVKDGSYALTVHLYSDKDGLQEVWNGTYTTQISGGLFNILLGSGSVPLPDAIGLNRPLWIGTQIDDSPVMKPLAPLSASPYALAIPNNSVTAEKIAANYVGSISVNGQKITSKGGDVNFTGTNGLSLQFDPVANAIVVTGNNSSTTGGKGDHILSNVVHSVTGTANQVLVNGTSGVQKSDDVTLTLPQSINTTSSPTFTNLTLSSNASVGGTLGVTGQTTTHGVTNTGLITTDSLHVNGGMTIVGSVHVAGGIDTLVSDGPIESGNTLIMDGTSTPRALSSDLGLNILTGFGNVTVIPAPGSEFASSSVFDMLSHNIINVSDPIHAQDAATKNYVTNQIATQSANLSVETTNRVNGDATNASAITAETNNRIAGDATNASAIATETTNRTSGDATNASAITTETTNRTSGDATNASAITSETNSRIAGDATNATAITTETTNRTSGDATNATAISTETTRAEAAKASAMKTWVSVPATSSSSGHPGDIAQDANYMYICTATNTWKRSPLSSW
ncbi:MAG TPA: hypothetical protein VG537_04770 [Candidatus Kapabacteria bacterium]|nr:hypothetical protein [Candidatus Kapabacteria bacterium]